MEASSTNAGSLHLAAHGVPTAAVSLDAALQVGGLAMGPADPSVITPGATVRVRATGGASTEWLGYTDTPYLHWAGVVQAGSSGADAPAVGQVRQLGNGSLGITYQYRDASYTTVRFAYKSSRTGSWTNVTIEGSTAIIDRVAPALIVFPSGRLVCYYGKTVNGQSTCVAKTSTDHGATWSDYATCATVSASSARSLRAEVVGDYVMMVSSVAADANKGTCYVFWSLDGGVSFGDGQTCEYTNSGGTSDTDCSVATTCAGLDGTYAIVALAHVDATDAPYAIYQLAPGGGFADPATIVGSYAAAGGEAALALAARDDGAIYLWFGSGTVWPALVVYLYVSHDGGLTWGRVGGDVAAGRTVFSWGNVSAGLGIKALSGGLWQGSAVLLVTNDAVSSSNEDDFLIETWWGGWDSHTFRNDGSETYVEVCYLPLDLPHGSGANAWTKSNVGAGIVGSLGSAGFTMICSGPDTSYWDAPAAFTPAAMESRNLTIVGRVASGGSVADDRSIIMLSIDEAGPNRQWVKLRFSTAQVRLLDNSGTLATISKDLTVGFEIRLFFKHDEPSAGAGLCSAYIRLTSETFWTTIVSNQTIAEEAGASGDILRFGGTVAGAVSWSLQLLRCSEDGDNEWQTAGFTNPTSLSGRGLGPLPIYVRSGLSLSAYHGAGVAGDTYTVRSTYTYAARYLWSSKRPSARWRTASDNTTHTVLFDGDGYQFSVGWVGLMRTNYPTATINFNTSDSWATPAYSVSLSSVVYSGRASSVGQGFIAVDGKPWRDGQYRSRNFGGGLGQRWFVDVGNTVTYEIVDNEEDRLICAGIDLSGFPSVAFRIFTDRMSVRLPSTVRYEFMQLSIPTAQTADNYYETGLLWAGVPLELVQTANGYSRDYAGNVVVTDAENGAEILTSAGPLRRRKRVAWDPTDDANFSGFPSRLRHYLGAVDISTEPVVLVEDGAHSTDFFLGVVDGPLTYEQVVGREGIDEFARIAQLPFREFL